MTDALGSGNRLQQVPQKCGGGIVQWANGEKYAKKSFHLLPHISSILSPAHEGSLGYCTCAQCNQHKRRNTIGSSVSKRTIGTFLSQTVRHEDDLRVGHQHGSSNLTAIGKAASAMQRLWDLS